MKNRIVRSVTLVTVLALALLISVPGSVLAADPIKIGFLFDVTGPLAPVGLDNQQGAIIALEQAGYQLMGRPIKAIIEDSATDVNTTLDKARKLAEVDKVRLIVGPIFGGAQQAMGGYADKVPIPVITIGPSQNVEVIKNNWSFLAHSTCEAGGYPMGVYAAEKLGYKTATTMASDFVAGHEFIDGFKKGFEAKGGKVIQQQWYPLGTKDFVPFMTAAKQADCLVTWWPGGDAFGGFKAYKDLNIKMPIIQASDGGITANPAINKRLGDVIAGVYAGVTYSDKAAYPGNKEFVEQYTKKFGAGPGANAGGSYISTKIALAAIEKAGKDESPQALKKALLSLKIDTIRGPLSFNEDRIATHDVPVVVIEKNLDSKIVGGYRMTAKKVGQTVEIGLAK